MFNFSKETLAKVKEYERKLQREGMPVALRQMRVTNYRRSLELDPTSYKPSAIKARASGRVREEV